MYEIPLFIDHHNIDDPDYFEQALNALQYFFRHPLMFSMDVMDAQRNSKIWGFTDPKTKRRYRFSAIKDDRKGGDIKIIDMGCDPF